MPVWNTIVGDSGDGTFTCNYDLKREARQIDYIAAKVPRRYIKSCRVMDSELTLTDHRLLILRIQALSGCPRYVHVQRGNPILACRERNRNLKKRIDIKDQITLDKTRDPHSSTAGICD